MKTFTIASIMALAAVGSAQFDKIPSCALTCFVGPLTSDGCSSLTDFKCHCEKGASLLSTVQPCVQGACSPADQATTIQAVQETCAGVGVPINIPDTSAAPSAAPSPSASAAPVASSAAASAASSAAAAVSSAVASAASSLASAASSALATSAASASASATPTLSQFTGGAPQATKAAGLLGAAALAMLAL
ncbi:CFEM-domain-containing protein [Pyrenochaeta sp. DS3sAY3a]|nr:CFEM-domain-containing protein [Pyrenochaeta sp. DS3sAY3a]